MFTLETATAVEGVTAGSCLVLTNFSEGLAGQRDFVLQRRKRTCRKRSAHTG